MHINLWFACVGKLVKMEIMDKYARGINNCFRHGSILMNGI